MVAVLIKTQKYGIFVRTVMIVAVLITTQRHVIFVRTANMITVLIRFKTRHFC